MPTIKQHIKKSKYNEDFFENVKHEYQDWAITGLFYAALHLVEAFLATKSIHVENHTERSKYFALLKELKPIYHEYKSLYEYSVNARYKMTNLSVESINESYRLFYTPLKNTLSKLTNT